MALPRRGLRVSGRSAGGQCLHAPVAGSDAGLPAHLVRELALGHCFGPRGSPHSRTGRHRLARRVPSQPPRIALLGLRGHAGCGRQHRRDGRVDRPCHHNPHRRSVWRLQHSVGRLADGATPPPFPGQPKMDQRWQVALGRTPGSRATKAPALLERLLG